MEFVVVACLSALGMKWSADKKKKVSEEQPILESSKPKVQDLPVSTEDVFQQNFTNDAFTRQMYQHRGIEIADANVPIQSGKREQFQTADIVPMTRDLDLGQIRNTNSNFGVTNIRSNQPVMEQIRVGPGLGLDPSVPASDGFHNMYRPDQYLDTSRLTTLPGTYGVAPASSIHSGTSRVEESYTFDKTFKLPEQGKGRSWATGQTNLNTVHVKSEMGTARGQVGDVNHFGIANQTNVHSTTPQSKYTLTGNKKVDKQPLNHGHVSGPGGYLQDTSLTSTLLGNRSNKMRDSNPGGNMNLLLNPKNQFTKERTEQKNTYIQPVDGGRFQNEQVRGAQEMNPYKGIGNSRAQFDTMTLAEKQLDGNPYNISILKTY